jgi:hypothetical protein
MAKFTLIAGLPANYEEVVADRANPPLRGDGFLLTERSLIDPKTSKQVGRLIARVPWMELPANGALRSLAGSG